MTTPQEQTLRSYVESFNRHDIEAVTGMAETAFHGTHAKSGRIVSACGPEVVEFVENKIKELRDYHRLTS